MIQRIGPISDSETAASAVRNLNNVDVGGRPLRIDLADSDPFLEGKTTVRGELMDSGGPIEPRSQRNGIPVERSAFMASIPPGIEVAPNSTSLDAISHFLATANSTQLTEVLAHMKVCYLSSLIRVPQLMCRRHLLSPIRNRHGLSWWLTPKWLMRCFKPPSSTKSLIPLSFNVCSQQLQCPLGRLELRTVLLFLRHTFNSHLFRRLLSTRICLLIPLRCKIKIRLE